MKSKAGRQKSSSGAASNVLSAVRPNSNDMRIEDVALDEESYQYRVPLKFGGAVVDRVTLLNVRCTVTGRSGRSVVGFGSMPLGNIWSFPSRTMPYGQTLHAMQELARRIRDITAEYRDFGHPVEINHHLEPAWITAATDVSAALQLDSAIPKLCTLVTGSPFDAAIHDAYGKLHGCSVYRCYGTNFLAESLGRYLGPDFDGHYLEEFLSPVPKPRMPLYHLVGALDPLTEKEIGDRLNDGLPETLPDWISFNGLTHFKIKLNGDDLAWDRERVLRVHSICEEHMRKRLVADWWYSLDFNERCPNVDYLTDLLRQIREQALQLFRRIQYVEQPTARDLETDRQNLMHEASKLRPVVIDESLTDLGMLMLAREMGYTGTALKACKGQSQALLMAAAARRYEMFLCVQDLTCPGASLIHSAGLAAHIPGVAAIEANARQYVPAANRVWESRFPGIFVVTDGHLATGELTGPGLGAVD